MRIILLVISAMVLAFFVNRWLQRLIAPRQSFARFLLYLLLCLALAFGLSFLMGLVILKLLPLPKR